MFNFKTLFLVVNLISFSYTCNYFEFDWECGGGSYTYEISWNLSDGSSDVVQEAELFV